MTLSKASTPRPIKTTKNGAPKLRRALTAFNLYTTFLRKKIIEGTHLDGIPATVQEVQQISLQHKTKTKRVHRKTHGKYTFQELSRIIAAGWKELPQDQKVVFEDQAKIEKMEREQKIASMMQDKLQESKKTAVVEVEISSSSSEEEEESSYSSSANSSSSSSCASEEWNAVPSYQEQGFSCEEQSSEWNKTSSSSIHLDDTFFQMSKEDEGLLAILEETIMNDDNDDDENANDVMSSNLKLDVPQTASIKEDSWEVFTNSATFCPTIDTLFTSSLDAFEVEALYWLWGGIWSFSF